MKRDEGERGQIVRIDEGDLEGLEEHLLFSNPCSCRGLPGRLLPEQALMVDVNDLLPFLGYLRFSQKLLAVPVGNQFEMRPARFRCLIEQAALS